MIWVNQWRESTAATQGILHPFGINFPKAMVSAIASSRRWYNYTSQIMTFIVPGYEHASDGTSKRLDDITIYGAYMNPDNTNWVYPTKDINYQMIVIGY